MGNELDYPMEMEQYFNNRADVYDIRMKKTATSFDYFYKRISDPIKANSHDIEIIFQNRDSAIIKAKK